MTTELSQMASKMGRRGWKSLLKKFNKAERLKWQKKGARATKRRWAKLRNSKKTLK